MEKWLLDIRQKQAELADKFAEERVALITQDIIGPNVDLEIYKLTMREELLQHALEAINGYTDWLATMIIRSNNFNVQPVPQCTVEDVKCITDAYGVPEGFFHNFLMFFHELIGENLPLVGKITQDGTLTPDEENLKKWADMFSW